MPDPLNWFDGLTQNWERLRMVSHHFPTFSPFKISRGHGIGVAQAQLSYLPPRGIDGCGFDDGLP